MACGGVFTIVVDRVAVTAAQDLALLKPSSTVPCKLVGVDLAQSSDAGDAQDEQLPIRVRTGMTTDGSGGGAYTPAGNITASSTARINDTTASSGGTIVERVCDAFNVRGGWKWKPTPKEEIIVPASGRLAVNLPVAPADSLTVSLTVTFEELA